MFLKMSSRVSEENAHRSDGKPPYGGYWPVFLVVLLVAVSASLAIRQNTKLAELGLRDEVRQELLLIRAGLNSAIDAGVSQARGLARDISAEPNMTYERFAYLADQISGHNSAIKNVAFAPNLVVTMVYPFEGNSGAIGLDYRNEEAQRDAVLFARDTGQALFVGPVDLVQGGSGFIARLPVFNDANETSEFLGILSVVIGTEALYVASGLDRLSQDLDISIASISTADTAKGPFFGAPEVLRRSPESIELAIMDTVWRISATPRDGWNRGANDQFGFDFLIATSSLVVIGLSGLANYYSRRRMIIYSRLRERESALRRVTRRLDLALKTSEIGIWEYDPVDSSVVLDVTMQEMCGLGSTQSRISLDTWLDVVLPDDRSDVRMHVEGAFNSDEEQVFEFRILTPLGDEKTVRSIGKPPETYQREKRLLVVTRDISEDERLRDKLTSINEKLHSQNRDLRDAGKQIEYLALHDDLTGLPNRRHLEKWFRAFNRGDQSRSWLRGLLLIDLDGFKYVNDNLGHSGGDHLLVDVARRVGKVLGPGEFVARLGGDEFAILCTDLTGRRRSDEEVLGNVSNEILATLREPFSIFGMQIRIGASIGISVQGSREASLSDLLADADAAMYRAKKRGRNSYVFSSHREHEVMSATSSTVQDVLRALEDGKFEPYYQPQFDLRTGEIVGAEALARWRHDDGTISAPGAFFQIMTDLRVEGQLDRLILERVRKDLERLDGCGLCLPKVSVNISARRLDDPGLLTEVRKLDWASNRLSFEILESVFMDERNIAQVDNISGISEMGISLEVDDFGTGFSSITSLLKWRPYRVKIDGSLVRASYSSKNRPLLEATVGLGKSLGIEVCAEGIETLEQVELVRELGCDVGQGYHLARPMSIDALTDFLTQHSVSKRPDLKIVAS